MVVWEKSKSAMYNVTGICTWSAFKFWDWRVASVFNCVKVWWTTSWRMLIAITKIWSNASFQYSSKVTSSPVKAQEALRIHNSQLTVAMLMTKPTMILLKPFMLHHLRNCWVRMRWTKSSIFWVTRAAITSISWSMGCVKYIGSYCFMTTTICLIFAWAIPFCHFWKVCMLSDHVSVKTQPRPDAQYVYHFRSIQTRDKLYDANGHGDLPEKSGKRRASDQRIPTDFHWFGQRYGGRGHHAHADAVTQRAYWSTMECLSTTVGLLDISGSGIRWWWRCPSSQL